MSVPGTPPSRIVSSAHLVSEDAAELSEFEYGLMVAGSAFNRWMVRCMAAANTDGAGDGAGLDMAALDVQVLHTVNHRDREKKLADICFTLNVEETHLVNYALKKLVKAGLVAATKRGKEAHYATTRDGKALCARYRDVRDACLIETLAAVGAIDNAEVGQAASVLRALSGLYDQAARAATSL